MYAYVALHHS